MFGIGMASAYGDLSVLGIKAAFLVAVGIRLLVGAGWFALFSKSGKTPYYAFIPFLGPYTAFRLVWDDFSFAAIFAGTTLVAFIAAAGIGIENPIISACAVVNFILWWFMALLTGMCYQVNMFIAFLYGGIPWLGALLMGFWPSATYKGPWSSDPEAEQNLSSKERKKRRKKAAKEAKRKG